MQSSISQLPSAKIAPPTFPAKPTNGGRLEKAAPKIGEWLCEPKYNGWRALVHTPSGAMWNRHGKRLSINGEFAAALEKLAEIHAQGWPLEWLDVEALERRHGIGKGSLIILDSIDLAAHPYQIRRQQLENLFLELDLTPKPDFPLLSIPPLIYPTLDVWRDLQRISALLNTTGNPANNFYEGVVMKKASAPYPIQLRSESELTRAWVKHRWEF